VHGVTTAHLRGLGRPTAVDAAVALVFAALAQLEVWAGDMPGPAGAKMLLALATTLPLAWRTAAPLPAVVATVTGYAVAVVLGVPADEPLVPMLAPLLAIYSLGAHASRSNIIAGGALAISAYAVASLAGPDQGTFGFIAISLGVVGAIGVGRAVRELGFETDLLEARTSQLERERDEMAQVAVAEERARIARELHDVIGHSISVMGVQAGAVRRRLTAEQEAERDALLGVERVGREAVEEMQRLLGLLRANGEEPATSAALTAERVEEMAAEMRRAGLEVELRVEGEIESLPPGRALAAFRILQEALTNALKHAPGARVDVTVRRTPSELRIEVVDDGHLAAAVSPRAGGHGLVGMRERAALYGGTLEAGPRAGGGFEVVARLPEGRS
jgi:signal transduction histidine kinase